MSNDDSMQFTKTKSGAKPTFDHVRYGDVVNRIGADRSNGNAGGEVRPEKFINGPNSSGVTRNIGSDVPKKGHCV
jgi:hypothetical protein